MATPADAAARRGLVPGRRPTLVEQVRERLLEELDNGTWATGDQLPNEQEMCQRYSVSRATIREVYRALIDAGYLTRRHGTGTFVTRVPTRHALESTLSYTDMIRSAGMVPGVRVISTSVRQADADERAELHLDAKSEVIEVERVRTADGTPVVYSVDRIPANLLSADDSAVTGGSLYSALETVGAGPRTAWARLQPVAADPTTAGHLGVDPGTPILQIDETDYDGSGRPVMRSAEWHLSNTFELWLNRRARSAGS
jgi:GntR family transcriptional regulator